MYYNKFDPYILPSPSTITDGKMTPQHAPFDGLVRRQTRQVCIIYAASVISAGDIIRIWVLAKTSLNSLI